MRRQRSTVGHPARQPFLRRQGTPWAVAVRAVVTAVAIAGATATGAAAQSRGPQLQAGEGWIIDKAANCGTSNPFANGRETISWSGGCLNGRLHGPGVLIWFEDGVETERDEGIFRNGELHGEAVITLSDRTTIYGSYRDGSRHGEFMLIRPDGTYVQSLYADGELVSQRRLDRREAAAWRAARSGDRRLAHITVEQPERPAEAPAAPAPVPAPAPSAVPSPVPAPPRAAVPTAPAAPPFPVPRAAVPAPLAAAAPPPPLAPPPLAPAAAPRAAPTAETSAIAAPPAPARSVAAPEVAAAPARPQPRPAVPPTAAVPGAPAGSVPAEPRAIVSPAPAAAPAPAPLPVRAAPTPPPAAAPGGLLGYATVDGRAMLTVSSYIPGGINMVPSGEVDGAATNARRQIEAMLPPVPAVTFDPPGTPAPNARYRIPGTPARAAAPGVLETLYDEAPPPAGPRLRVEGGRVYETDVAGRPMPAQPGALPLVEAPRAAGAAPLRLRPPPATAPAAPADAAPAPAPVATPARLAPPAAPTPVASDDPPVTLRLAGADLRDAVRVVLGDFLKTRYSIDPGVRGVVAVGSDPTLPRSQVLGWLRAALNSGGADLAQTEDGYRVFALAAAPAQIAPPAQAERLFVDGYAAERAGRTDDARRAYAEIGQRFPATAMATMAQERLAGLEPRVQPAAARGPGDDSLAGSYLCSRRGLYPNDAKWCGFVRGDRDGSLAVEVREIAYNGLFAVGFRAAPCTGNEFIGVMSHGKVVEVPRVCMEPRW